MKMYSLSAPSVQVAFYLLSIILFASTVFLNYILRFKVHNKCILNTIKHNYFSQVCLCRFLRKLIFLARTRSLVFKLTVSCKYTCITGELCVCVCMLQARCDHHAGAVRGRPQTLDGSYGRKRTGTLSETSEICFALKSDRIHLKSISHAWHCCASDKVYSHFECIFYCVS